MSEPTQHLPEPDSQALTQQPAPTLSYWQAFKRHRPTLPEAAASLLKTLVGALFLLTFVFQPFLVPSESMEHTLLVGDFLLMNKQAFGPHQAWMHSVLPYQDIARGDIVIFHHTKPALLIKRIVAVPGDRIKIADGHVLINDHPIDEPYATFEPTLGLPYGENFPAINYTDRSSIDPKWWKEMPELIHGGDLVIPEGKFFVLGDNRNHSADSRVWGLVDRKQIVGKPLVIYFSLKRPSTTDTLEASNDRLGHDADFVARLADFARWKRIFRIVH